MQKKNFIYAMLCVCVAVLLSGCGTKQPDTVPTTATPIPGILQLAPENTDIEEPTIAPLENMEVTIYTLNEDSLEKEAITVLVTLESELTAELIVEQVVDAMEDGGFYIGINDIITEGDTVIVDFRSDAAPVLNVGASVEGAILDIIGQSILDNLPNCKKIMYRIEGGAYQTGHLEFELDDVYIGR